MNNKTPSVAEGDNYEFVAGDLIRDFKKMQEKLNT